MREASPEPLSIDISFPVEGVALVELSGELEVVTVAEFSTRMADLEGGGPSHVVIDVSETTFIDSSGISALVHAVRSVEAWGGTAVVAAPSAVAQRVFAITLLSQVVPVEQDRAVALAMARPLDPGGGSAG